MIRELDNFLGYMSKILRFPNFRWITLNKKRNTGYYSFKSKEEEICLDCGEDGGWSVYLCNKWEEALDEVTFPTIKEALEQANKFYQCFGKLDILYK